MRAVVCAIKSIRFSRTTRTKSKKQLAANKPWQSTNRRYSSRWTSSLWWWKSGWIRGAKRWRMSSKRLKRGRKDGLSHARWNFSESVRTCLTLLANLTTFSPISTLIWTIWLIGVNLITIGKSSNNWSKRWRKRRIFSQFPNISTQLLAACRLRSRASIWLVRLQTTRIFLCLSLPSTHINSSLSITLRRLASLKNLVSRMTKTTLKTKSPITSKLSTSPTTSSCLSEASNANSTAPVAGVSWSMTKASWHQPWTSTSDVNTARSPPTTPTTQSTWSVASTTN